MKNGRTKEFEEINGLIEKHTEWHEEEDGAFEYIDTNFVIDLSEYFIKHKEGDKHEHTKR